MDHSVATHGRRLEAMSQDLAFVEDRLVRAMAGPQVDQSLENTLDRLRELRELVAGIKAKHEEVASAWNSVAAAARGQACCLQYLRTLREVAEANGSWPHDLYRLDAAGQEFAQKFWASEVAVHGLESELWASASGHVSRDVFTTMIRISDADGESPASVPQHLHDLQRRQGQQENTGNAAGESHASRTTAAIYSQ